MWPDFTDYSFKYVYILPTGTFKRTRQVTRTHRLILKIEASLSSRNNWTYIKCPGFIDMSRCTFLRGTTIKEHQETGILRTVTLLLEVVPHLKVTLMDVLQYIILAFWYHGCTVHLDTFWCSIIMNKVISLNYFILFAILINEFESICIYIFYQSYNKDLTGNNI